MHVRFVCPRPRLFAALATAFLVVWLVAAAVFLYGFVALVGALPACSTPEPASAGAAGARREADPECRSTPSETSTSRPHGPYGDTAFDAAQRRPRSPSEAGSGSAARSGRRR